MNKKWIRDNKPDVIADLRKQVAELKKRISSLLDKPASKKCPHCGTIIKTV